MGLALRYNLFHNTTAASVYGAYVSYYEKRGRPLQTTGEEHLAIRFHQEDRDWVAVDLDAGWEWSVRREAQRFVSQRLGCPGFLVFVYDGDYWGYEFFDHGEVLDRFVQESTGKPIGFPGEDCRGRAETVAEHLPPLRADQLAPYLVQKHDFAIPDGMNVLARPGDHFRRFDECAVVDFLRMLGVSVRLQGDHVRLESPVYRTVFRAAGS